MEEIFLSLLLFIIPARTYSIEIPRYEVIREATITAYNSEIGQTDSSPYITASGTTTTEGIIACDRKYPFGTKFIIMDKKYVCEDRMNIRYHGKNYFDIWMEKKSDAIEFGKQKADVLLIRR